MRRTFNCFLDAYPLGDNTLGLRLDVAHRLRRGSPGNPDLLLERQGLVDEFKGGWGLRVNWQLCIDC